MAEQKGAMPNPVISTEGLPREEWLAYRRKGIGGSDAAAVLGISPFRTGVDLYYHTFKKVCGSGPDEIWQYCGRCFCGENVERGIPLTLVNGGIPG